MPRHHFICDCLPRTVAAALLFASVTCSYAQSVEEARADIRSTYGFEPDQMSFDEQARKAPSLSALWDRYSRTTNTYGPALRAELRAAGNPAQLYCDGGMLLLTKSESQEDEALGLVSLQRCTLAEIQHTPYFYTLHSLAVRGIDTFDLQARILAKPKCSVFIVQHALSLGQDYAFLYPLLVQDESRYVPRLIARLREERDPVAQKSLLRALWYAASPDAESALRSFAALPSASEVGKADAQAMVKNLDLIRGWKSDDLTLKRVRSIVNIAADEPLATDLRDLRRQRMRSVSDEALYELEAYTLLIYRAKK